MQDEQGNQLFAFLIPEPVDPLVGGVADGIEFFRMFIVVGKTFLEIGVIGTDFDVVDIWDEASFLKPSLECRQWHDGDGIGGENPFQIRGDVVSLDCQDVAVSELFSDGHERRHPLLSGRFRGRIAQIDAWFPEPFLEEIDASWLMVDFAAKTSHGAFSIGRDGIPYEQEMSDFVEIQQNGVFVRSGNGAGLYD